MGIKGVKIIKVCFRDAVLSPHFSRKSGFIFGWNDKPFGGGGGGGEGEGLEIRKWGFDIERRTGSRLKDTYDKRLTVITKQTFLA